MNRQVPSCYDHSGSPDRLLTIGALFKQKGKASGALFDLDQTEDDRDDLMLFRSQKYGLEAVSQVLWMIKWKMTRGDP